MGRATAVLAFLLSCLIAAAILAVGPHLMTRLVPALDFAQPGDFGELVARESALPLAVARDNPPRLIIERTRINVGEVLRGEPAKFVFPLQNDGAGPLLIATATSCGCTVVECDKEIPAGGRSELVAELQTSKLEGLVTKSIDVQTNDPRQSRLRLELIANVVPAVELLPAESSTVALRWHRPTVHALQLRAAKSVQVTSVECSESFATTALEPVEESTSRPLYRLTLVFGPESPPGASEVRLTVATTAKHEPQFSFTVRCEKGIIVSPPSVLLRQPMEGSGAEPALVVISKREGNLQIGSANASDANLDVKVQALKPGLAYRLSIAMSNQHSMLPVTGSVVVRTNDPDQPELTIPVWFMRSSPP